MFSYAHWIIIRLLACVLLLSSIVTQSAAQSVPLANQTRNPAKGGPSLQTQEQVRSLVSELDDRQVRALLLKRLGQDVAKREQTLQSEKGRPIEVVRAHMKRLGAHFVDVFARIPAIPSGLAEAFHAFQSRRAERSWIAFVATLLVSVITGLVGAIVVPRFLTRALAKPQGKVPRDEARGRIVSLASRLLGQVTGVIVFWTIAEAINMWLNATAEPDRDAMSRLLIAVALTWLTVVVARFLLSPLDPQMRLYKMDDQTAALLVRRVGWIAALLSFGGGLIAWMVTYGIPVQQTWLAFWLSLALHLLLASTIWQARSGISLSLVTSGETNNHQGASYIGWWWPRIFIAFLVLHWLSIEILAPTSEKPRLGVLDEIVVTLIVFASLPLIEQVLRAIAASLLPVDPDNPEPLQAADRESQQGVERILRVIVTVGLIALLLWVWDIDLMDIAEQSLGVSARALLNMGLIIVGAYALWELTHIVTERQIVVEQVTLGFDPSKPQAGDGEGGGAGARLGTILPLIRIAIQISIIVLATLAVLGEAGVNILPILAGAGVVGIAVGFGAQTLVKDIISGVFFLIDDAFRKGEYIDIGDVKGTVERISIRSMQLRHHNGPLNTVPFGDIRHVKNFSRDWVVMKLPLRLTYDTDPEQVRKMIKKLGQEMMEDPVLGPLFLQPLKSQGVIQMEDSAMIMRVKFMTRPGDQWALRRVIFAKIHDLFEANGIRFANREVTVRIADESSEGHDHAADTRRKAASAAARVVQDEDQMIKGQ